MKRLSLGWRYARQSLTFVRRDGALSGLAAIGFALGLLLAVAPFAAAAWAFDAGNDAVGFVAAALACLALYVGLTFSGVAIACAANEVLAGRDARVFASLRAAAGRLRPVLGWSVAGTLVSLVLALVRRKGGRGANVLASAGSEAWSLVTFLAVPVVAFEGLGPIETLKRSAALYRQRWGEQAVGTVSIGLVFFLASVPPLMLIVAAVVEASVHGPSSLGVGAAIVGLVALSVIAVSGRAASATFGAILYRFAVSGDVPATIDREDLENVARPAIATSRALTR